jgi:DNA-binding beta-propeller fold protein YncE
MVQTCLARCNQPSRLRWSRLALILAPCCLILLLVLTGSQSHFALAAPVSSPAGLSASSCAPTLAFTITADYMPMGLAYDRANKRLFVANETGPDNGSLSVAFVAHRLYFPIIARQTDVTASTSDADAGSNLGAAAVGMAGWPETRTVTEVDGARSIAYDAARNRIYVVGGDKLYVVDGSTYALLGDPYPLGGHYSAFAVAYNPTADKIYVSDWGQNRVKIINIHVDPWTVTNLDPAEFPLMEPAYIAVNPATNKVYVSNHNGGGPISWVTVIDGSTDRILTNVHLAGDLYGVAVDALHNRVYATSISVARVFAIDGATDMALGDIQIVRASDSAPVPLRMVSVNPSVGTDTHVWLTSSEADDGEGLAGMDRLILLSFNSAGWPPAVAAPVAMAVGEASWDGLVVDPDWGRVFVSSSGSNVVTAAQDTPMLCVAPLGGFAGEPFLAVTRTY